MLLSNADCVVAVVPFDSAVETDHVPEFTCATPVDADVFCPVPPFVVGKIPVTPFVKST